MAEGRRCPPPRAVAVGAASVSPRARTRWLQRSRCRRLGCGRPVRARGRAGPVIATPFIGCAIAANVVQCPAGKPLSAVVQGKPGHGITLGGGAIDQARQADDARRAAADTTRAAVTCPSYQYDAERYQQLPAASTTPTATTPAVPVRSAARPTPQPPVLLTMEGSVVTLECLPQPRRPSAGYSIALPLSL
jgi:hypothetical protein